MRDHQLIVAALLFLIAYLNSIPMPLMAIPTMLILFVVVGAAHFYAGGNPLLALAAGAAGALIGDVLAYRSGAAHKGDLNTVWPNSWSPESSDQAMAYIGRKGALGLVLSKFHTTLRSFAPLAAGAASLPFGAFLAASLVAGLLWAAVLLAPVPILQAVAESRPPPAKGCWPRRSLPITPGLGPMSRPGPGNCQKDCPMTARHHRKVEIQKKKARRVIPRAKTTRIQGNTAGVRKRLKKLAGKARSPRPRPEDGGPRYGRRLVASQIETARHSRDALAHHAKRRVTVEHRDRPPSDAPRPSLLMRGCADTARPMRAQTSASTLPFWLHAPDRM